MKNAPITISHEELSGSPIEDHDEEGFTAVRRLKCAWSDRFSLAKQLQGGTDSTGQYFVPARYPDRADARVVTVKVEPFHNKSEAADGDSRIASYDDARLTVQYETPRGGSTADDEETLVSESLAPIAEFLTLPGEYYWDSGAAQVLPLGESGTPGKLIRSIDWIYTRHKIVNPPAALLTQMGSVNSAVITSASLGWTFDPETLLFNPPSLRRVITTEGVRAWEAELTFSYRRSGWNKYWNPDTGQFDPVYLLGSANAAKIYDLSDFTNLQI